VGRIDHSLELSKEEILDLSDYKIEIILSETEIAALDPVDGAASKLTVAINALALSAPIPVELAQGASVLCVEVDPQSRQSVARIAALRAEQPDLPIIALVREADLSLVRALLRQGVNDVIELPLSITQLTESVSDLVANRKGQTPRNSRKVGRLICVVKSIGGVGATNVAVNLASTLASEGDQRACLFDLDVQFGNAATYLGAAAEPSLTELLDGGARIDGDFLRTVMSVVAGGARFVPAPAEILPIEAIDEAQLRHVLQTARGEFEFVVADLPANWANWTLSVVSQSDLIILVVELSVGSLRQGKRQLQLLKAQGVDSARIAILVNRVEKRLFKTIGLDDAAKVLGHPVQFHVHNDYPLMSAANNQGVVVADLNKRSTIARDFARTAQAVAEMTDAVAP